MSQRSDAWRETEQRRLILIRYLLGELDDQEKERIEERYFGDNDFYTELLLAEDELIDSYVLDDLPRRERVKFEQEYVNNPHRFKKVESNRVLLETITKRPSPLQRLRNSLLGFNVLNVAPPRYSLAVPCLVALFCGLLGWLIVERQRMNHNLEQARAEWQRKENDYQTKLAALQPQPNDSSKPPEDPKLNGQEETGNPEEHFASREGPEKGRGAPSVIAFTLSSNVVRSLRTSVKPLVIPRGTVLVRMKVKVEQNDFQSYNVSLQKVGGPELWRQSISKEASAFSATQVEVNLPASLFERGEYFLEVTASHPGSKEETLALHQIRAINRNKSGR